MKKQLLAGIAAIAMLFGLCPVHALAAETELPVDTEAVTEQPPVQQVQALIDNLPDPEDITPDSRSGVEEQLTAVDSARMNLTDEEVEQLNISRYQAAVSALMALDEQAVADVPMPVTDVTVDSSTPPPDGRTAIHISSMEMFPFLTESRSTGRLLCC